MKKIPIGPVMESLNGNAPVIMRPRDIKIIAVSVQSLCAPRQGDVLPAMLLVDVQHHLDDEQHSDRHESTADRAVEDAIDETAVVLLRVADGADAEQGGRHAADS